MKITKFYMLFRMHSIARFQELQQFCSMKVLNYGAKKEFPDRVAIDELYTRYRLKPELICEDVTRLL